MGLRKLDDLSQALEQNEIVPWYQPQLELRTGKLCGFEVLARWMHPNDGIVSPAEFIPVAEQSGLISDLTFCLLRQVFSTARSLPDQLSFAVNISPLQLHDPDFPKRLEQEAGRAGFPVDRLKLEITESALVGDMNRAYLVVQELKDLGAKLSLDDFGTGYSSLRHLQSLPFDELKVDASFIRSMGLNRDSRKIAAAVIGLGQSLGLTTVAEGVEMRNQADMLLWLGCDVGQGWLFGRPVPESKLAGALGTELFPQEETEQETTTYGPVAPWLQLPPNQRLAQLEAIYDGVPVGLCFLDPSLRFLSVNRCLAEMTGLSVAELLGRHVADVMSSAYERFAPLMTRALRGESPGQIEVQGSRVHAGGMRRRYLLLMEPARDEAGEVVGLSVALLETTHGSGEHVVAASSFGKSAELRSADRATPPMASAASAGLHASESIASS